jgi:Protein of unknown function (DUF664)
MSTAAPEPPLRGDEAATLVGFLEWQRATLACKCAGLDAAGLAATVGASSMTLGGLLKHQARSEDYWFCHQLLGRDIGVPWGSLDWASDWGGTPLGMRRKICGRCGRRTSSGPGLPSKKCSGPTGSTVSSGARRPTLSRPAGDGSSAT